MLFSKYQPHKEVPYTEKTKTYYHQWINEKSSRKIPPKRVFGIASVVVRSVLSWVALLCSVSLAFYRGVLAILAFRAKKGDWNELVAIPVVSHIGLYLLCPIKVVPVGGQRKRRYGSGV